MTPDKINRNGIMQIPAMFLPGFRTAIAIQDGVEKNLLFRTWGGLGDQICAEPTLRFALEQFKDCEVYLASECPELFEHLEFKKVFNLKTERPIYENYLMFDTITPPNDTNMVWQFFSHMLTNCVDFPSMCALRSQLPIKSKELKISSKKPSSGILDFINGNECVFIHAGKHWASKTFPKDFWDSVISEVIKNGKLPVLIGANTDDNRGTVNVDMFGCLDLRNRLSISESIWLLQNATVLLTNDSAPLHMAASGPAWIGYVATCKHPDFITHWRNGEFGYRMKNFGKGGIWDIINMCPNASNEVSAEFVDEAILRSWLPDPIDFARWAVSKFM